jgi:DNA repair exonuclease SbcCD ATPase subunit
MNARWPLVLAALCVVLSVFCAMQWGREADLRAELRAVRIAERDQSTKSAEAIRLGETYASEIRRLDARVGELKQSDETLRKELAAARSAEQAARQSIAELTPLRTALAQQNESIRRQNETVTKQNAAIRSQNESLRKLVAERDEVVRLLNERTELLNKLNAAGSAK